jgi:hypothetical protein
VEGLIRYDEINESTQIKIFRNISAERIITELVSGHRREGRFRQVPYEGYGNGTHAANHGRHSATGAKATSDARDLFQHNEHDVSGESFANSSSLQE